MSADGQPGFAGAAGIRRRVYLLMATGIFFPLAVMITVGILWLRALDERLLSGRLSAAQAVAAHYDEQLAVDLEVLQRLSATLGERPRRGEVADARQALRGAHEQFRFRERLFQLDATGKVVAEEPPGPQSDAPPPDDPVVAEVLRSGLPRLSGLQRGPHGPALRELVPVRALDGRVLGLVGGAFDPGRRGFGEMLTHLRRGQTGFAELVDAEGNVLVSTRPERGGTRTQCVARLAALIHAKRSESSRCSDCHTGTDGLSIPDELLTFAPLATAPWGLVIRQQAAEAMPSEGAIPWLGVVGGLVLQLALAAAFARGAAQSVIRPVAVLTREAERIAGGELGSSIPDLGGDEVGRLGRSLEAMRGNLKRNIERVAEANAELERRVAERTRELAEANVQLRARERDRAQLLGKVISAQEDERKRIARELHDETSQSLAVLAMGLEAAQDALRGGKVPRLDEVKAVAVRTLEDVHRLILDLRPSVLDDLGLFSAIRWYAERSLESRGIAVRCEFGELDRRLPPEMETALFRMCQETLSNVARHAKATAVLIEVGQEGDALRIDIEDDGRGFDPAEAARREGRRPWGLMGIRERAEILGGTARVDSAPGQGTRVSVRIPLPPEQPPAGEETPGGAEPAGGEGAAADAGGSPGRST